MHCVRRVKVLFFSGCKSHPVTESLQPRLAGFSPPFSGRFQFAIPFREDRRLTFQRGKDGEEDGFGLSLSGVPHVIMHVLSLDSSWRLTQDGHRGNSNHHSPNR